LFQVVKILHLEYKNQSINVTTVSSEILIKLINSLYGQSVECLNVKHGGTQNNQCVVTGKVFSNFYRSLVIIRVNLTLRLPD